MKVTGTIHKIFDSFTYTDNFSKQEFILDMTDGDYTELVKFQCVNDRRSQLSDREEGDQVEVHFNLKGREVTKETEVVYYTNLDAWKIDVQN